MGSITTRAYDRVARTSSTGSTSTTVSDLLAERLRAGVDRHRRPDARATSQQLADELGLHHLVGRGRPRPAPARQVRALRAPRVPRRPRRRARRRAGRAADDRARRVHRRRAGSSPCTAAHGELIERVAARWDKARELAGTQRRVRRCTPCSTSSSTATSTPSTAFERYYDDVADQVFGESPIEPDEAPPVVRDAQGAEPVRPHHRAAAEALATVVDRGPRPLPGRRRAVPARRRRAS